MESASGSGDAAGMEAALLPGSAKKLSAETGVRLSGVDLLRLSERQYRQLAMLVSSVCVVVISGNPLTPQQQVDFAKRLGDILIVPGVKRHAQQPEMFVVENGAGSRAGADFFHSDASFLPCPPSYTILAGAKVPDYGGNTMFSNQYTAWETLSLRLQEYLRTATARHGAARLTDQSQLTEGAPHHPLRRVHPLTRRTALYLTSLDRVQSIDGVPAAEGAAVLKFLYDHSCRSENIYRHQWTQDDVVIWDNRCTMHSAVGDVVSSDRVLHRVVCAGEAPAH